MTSAKRPKGRADPLRDTRRVHGVREHVGPRRGARADELRDAVDRGGAEAAVAEAVPRGDASGARRDARAGRERAKCEAKS